jgi:hypothetical protein
MAKPINVVAVRSKKSARVHEIGNLGPLQADATDDKTKPFSASRHLFGSSAPLLHDLKKLVRRALAGRAVPGERLGCEQLLRLQQTWGKALIERVAAERIDGGSVCVNPVAPIVTS